MNRKLWGFSLKIFQKVTSIALRQSANSRRIVAHQIGHEEVGRGSVDDDGEQLGWRSDRDVSHEESFVGPNDLKIQEYEYFPSKLILQKFLKMLTLTACPPLVTLVIAPTLPVRSLNGILKLNTNGTRIANKINKLRISINFIPSN